MDEQQAKAWPEQAAVVREAHRLMDQQGVSHSTYGQATRERYIREAMGTPLPFPPVAALAQTPERTFTRAEVLVVIKAQLATVPAGGGEAVCLRHLASIFASIE